MQKMNLSMQPCMMFQGNAAKAIDLYRKTFTQFEVTHITKNKDGTIMYSQCFLNEQPMICMDYTVAHRQTNSSAISIFVQCIDELELSHAFATLAKNGVVRMSLAPTPVSQLFGWVEDAYGVSWQLHLPPNHKKQR